MTDLSRRHLLIGLPFLAGAQESRFSAKVTVVTVLATVRDGDRRIVKDLGREDFVLLEDGRLQDVTYFSRESDLPLTIGLLVDTSNSQKDVMESERTASYRFLDQVMRPGKDLAFIAHFDTQVEIVQDLTPSKTQLSEALAGLTVPGEFATLIYSCIRQTSVDILRQQQGRKALILLSDGVQYLDKTTIEEAIEAAQRSDTMIFAILYPGTYPDPPRLPSRVPVPSIGLALKKKNGRTAMQRLARETGGAYYEVNGHDSIERIFALIEEALRSQYSLGYVPNVSGQNSKYRKIKLTVKTAGLRVQAREGYYAS